MNGHDDLRRACALAPLCAILALVLPLHGLRLAFAAPLTLFLPGYAIAAAAFVRHRPEKAQLLVTSVGISLSTLALGALVLNYLPGGIRSTTWAILLVAVVVLGCAIAARRREAPVSQQSPRRAPLQRPRPLSVALLAGGLLAALAALVMAATTFSVHSAVGHTQLWVVPAPSSGRNAFEVGVGNQQQTRVPYDLLVRIGSRPLVRRSFVLDPGEKRIVHLVARGARPSRQVPVVATLLRQHRTDRIDKRVRNWIPSPKGAE